MEMLEKPSQNAPSWHGQLRPILPRLDLNAINANLQLRVRNFFEA
jgi:hypothetical protein